jgi:hypothetical protein
MTVPAYLKSFVKVTKLTKSDAVLKVFCECGCTEFYLLENMLDAGEEQKIRAYEKRLRSWGRIENQIDPMTGKRYLVKKSFWGRISDKIPIDDLPSMKRTHILKVKCSRCASEKVIFDNRYHGYNAVTSDSPTPSEEVEYPFRNLQSTPTDIEIKITNDLTYEELEGRYTMEEVSNAFTNISIYTIQNRKKKVFEEETA